jgi:fatty acid/phospholipid biosynthesis enzyme
MNLEEGSRSVDIRNIEAEAAVIASLLLNPELYFYSEDLEPNHFTEEANAYVYFALKELAKKLDASEYGGAPLLGVNGYCIISHGSSDAKSICNAIRVANEYVGGNVLEHIKNALEKEDFFKDSNLAKRD